MTFTVHPSLRSVLPWCATIAFGTSIHLAYWITHPRTEVQIMTVPVPERTCASTPAQPAAMVLEDHGDLALRVLGDERYELDFDAVRESLIEDPARLAEMAHLIPSFHEGEQAGLKLYGVRRGSLLKLLGFKNGDLIKTVNGVKLKSSDAFWTIERPLEQIEVQLERRGKTFVKILVNRPNAAR